MRPTLILLALATFSQGCSSTSPGASTTDALCHFDAATFTFGGDNGNALQDIQGRACSGTNTCTESITGGPFCGDEGSHLDDYSCACTDGKVICVLVALGGGIATRGWCDGGDGSGDAGR
jgi:hypothetical protein